MPTKTDKLARIVGQKQLMVASTEPLTCQGCQKSQVTPAAVLGEMVTCVCGVTYATIGLVVLASDSPPGALGQGRFAQAAHRRASQAKVPAKPSNAGPAVATAPVPEK